MEAVMHYIQFTVPTYPYFLYAGSALFRAGDSHRKRSAFPIFDILFVEYGCLYMQEDGREYEVPANHALILCRGNTHRSYQPCRAETYFHWLHFNTAESFFVTDEVAPLPVSNAEGDKQTAPLIFPVCQKLSPDCIPQLYRLLKSLESCVIDRYHAATVMGTDNCFKGNRLKQQSIFSEILTYLSLTDSLSQGNQIAQRVLQYLNANYHHHEISLADMAQVAGCHPTHVIRCFRAEYGITPGRMLSKIRLEQAASLLRSSNLSCASIADLTGFSSASYFSKVFRAENGISPEGYRRQSE